MIKGVTHDFGTQKKVFHVISIEGEVGGEGGKAAPIFLSDLKAVFFVKSLEGRKDYRVNLEFEDKVEPAGLMKIKITFFDGEILEGTTHGYTPEREGFFIVPLEKDSNNLRVFVLSKSVKKVETWK